ncbi:complex I subunit 5 family protein [Histidinibacterium aquaticum]|uniref:Monovalent cation/H+ antiporter subunit D family protein n=1 Tax=Histidinibacterium aquaticum TaxID=2613962 RepID=A0A5J5GD60_9RHOB|nr:proton-conducting transporter membrane subunit [Histidinibacterium aquaticum]KAA9005753.1 monovalent cation/H+ antiporter subunit D family protein [Histidinibacterium aquaticum]
MNELLPLAILATSLGIAPVILAMPDHWSRCRTWVNLTAAAIKVALVAWISIAVANGGEFSVSLTIAPGLTLALQADALAVLFLALSAVLWFLTTIYAVGYLEGGTDRSRFFGFFSLCVASTVGIAMAANLFTFLVFFELLTLATWPLVVHRGSAEAHRAGRVYLTYTLGGGLALTLGTVWLYSLAGDVPFMPRGVLGELPQTHPLALSVIFALLIAGVGVKAALVPLHGWLPISMVAPAPVSALLHAVAVVKAGAFGIMRVVYDVYGVETVQVLGLAAPLAALAAFTILWGSIRALTQDDLKKRLAYSTVSQVSYITLGVALISPVAAIGGLAHLIHQGIMKITLFLAAGNFAEGRGVKNIRAMNGLGRMMPGATLAFTVGSLGMIGIPPLAGFVSKWYLGAGALDANLPAVIALLAGSSLLNAAYFLPILYRVWFLQPEEELPEKRRIGWMLAVPPAATATLVLVAGLLANAPFSPLGWTRFIVSLEYL